MTREEAIAFFKDMNECTYGDLEAVEMAIQALQAQAEPQVKCGACIHHHGALLECDIFGCKFEPKQADGDYISRQDAIEFFKDDVYVVNELKNMATVAIPSALTTEDYTELRDRFGEYVEFVVRDMVSGKGERWERKGVAIPSAEPCEDAISRQAVFDLLEDTNNGWIINEVSQLPSVKPQEPKTGHWKRISMDKYSEHAQYWYRCDKCGEHNLGNTNFCPNCGADMRGEQE